jgi:twinkle protein
MNFIEWDKIYLGCKTSGQKKVKCPLCIDRRKNKQDKSLSVNISKGVAKCHYCEAVSIRDNVQTETKKEYTLPSQKWQNYTNLSNQLVKWFEETRKIPQYVLKQLNITEEKHYQPQLKKEVNNIVFNFFEGDTIINKKYRSANKKFTQSAGTKRIFYNINAAINQKELYIVEGEMDVLSLYAVGIKNVISLPSGAQDTDDVWQNCKKYIESVEKFIIAVDNDTKGNEVKEKIAQRLGRYRCEFIEWNGKDANEDLISGTLEKTAYNKKRFPVSGTFTVSELYDGILDLYDNGLPETIYPKGSWFKGMKDMFSVMRGQLTVGTGIPSHGKSNFTDWYVLNLIKDYNLKASWFSPEHSPMSLYQTNLIEKVIGRNFWKDKEQHKRITKDEINQYKEWANEKIYLTDCEAGQYPTWTWILDKFKEQMYSFGIDIFVIDAFNKLLLPKGMSKIDAINEVLTKLTSFAQSNNVIIFLIAHPTKMQKDENGFYSMPTLYDVSGSADFRNQTHNGFTIYRWFENEENGQEAKTEFVNMKTKFNFQGNIGDKLDFKYCHINGRYYSDGIEPVFNLIDGKELIKEDVKDLFIDPIDAFDIDEVPF